MKTKQKIDKLVDFINTSEMDKYLKYRFNNFCRDVLYDDWKDSSPYYSEDEFYEIYIRVQSSRLFVPSDDYVDEFYDGREFYQSLDVKNAYIALGILMFKSYINVCFRSFVISHRGMKGFTEKIDEFTFKRDYLDRLFGFFSYYKREQNHEMEEKFVDETKEKFYILHKMTEMNFVYDFENGNSDNIDNAVEFIKDSYLCYLESLHLCFCHFNDDLKNIVFKESLLKEVNR